MNEKEKEQRGKLAARNAAEKRSLEEEIFALTTTLSRWRYSVSYITIAVTVAIILQLYIIFLE